MLLDASAFFWAVKEGLDLREHFVLDLTFYELWKYSLEKEAWCRIA